MCPQVRENAVQRLGEELPLIPGETLQGRELRFLKKPPNERQMLPRFRRDRE